MCPNIRCDEESRKILETKRGLRFKRRAQNKRKAPRRLDVRKAIAPNKMATEEGRQIQMLVSRCSTVQRTPVEKKETPHTTIQIPGRSDDDDKIYLRGYYVHW
jgi:hypothetical protein